MNETWDEAALERVFDEISEGLARDLLLYGQGYLVVEKARKQGMPETHTETLEALRRAADAYVHPDSKAEGKRLRLQKERRANQQHFRHHGAKR